MHPGIERLTAWARAIKNDIVALWIAAHDARTPLIAKLIAGAVAAYALSPIDLIPDFIPVIGYLDDLLVVPLGIALAVSMIPLSLMAEFRERARQTASRPTSRAAAAAIVLVWLVTGMAIGHWLWARVR